MKLENLKKVIELNDRYGYITSLYNGIKKSDEVSFKNDVRREKEDLEKELAELGVEV